MAPIRIGMRYARESHVLTCSSVRPEKNEPISQLISHAAQIKANSAVGQVAVQPLHTKAIIGFVSVIMRGLIFPIGWGWQMAKKRRRRSGLPLEDAPRVLSRCAMVSPRPCSTGRGV